VVPATEESASGVRLAELLAALSLAVDLGLGLPMEHVLRQTLIALRLAEAQHLSAAEREAIYYVSLLAWVGCAVDAHELANLFGDESAMMADSYQVNMTGLPAAMFFARHLGAGSPPWRRAGLVGQFMLTGGRSVGKIMADHCRAAGQMAERLGFDAAVREPLLQAFERWDGKGSPGTARADQLSPAIRVVHLADIVEVFHRSGGVEAAVEVARSRSGTQFDPELVERFCACADEVLDGIDEVAGWDAVIAGEPGLERMLAAAELDAALETIADFADLKSAFTLGHSRGVAQLAGEAARALGLPDDNVTLVRRAGLVHDLGVIGVSSTIWNKTRPLTESDRERVRTHPYLAERTLARAPALVGVGTLAALHHERLDGSGYPRGLTGDVIPAPARVLAAADVYHALTEPRPHRLAFSRADAEEILRDEVAAGRLDGPSVTAVLAAAGHRTRKRTDLPFGLTARELEVLEQLARGHANPEIARRLVVSRKTVGAHLEHIYAKLGVSTRTEAALFAMRHGLIASGTAHH
jgi:HD-GYP domain-containing protein (c-di-GMP phosphodiesterase class II)